MIRQIFRSRPLLAYVALQASAAAIFVFLDEPEDTLFWHGLFDVGHCLLFAFLMWSVLRIIESVRPASPYHLLYDVTGLAAVLLLAGFSELLQRFQPTRDPSVGDVLRDTAGAVASFLTFALSGRATGASTRRRVVLRGLALALLLAVFGEFALVVNIYLARNRAFPTLLAFDDSRWQRALVRVRGGRLGVLGPSPLSGTGPCAPIVLQPGRVPAWTLAEPYPDWSSHNWLVFSVASAEEVPFKLRIRVNDAQYAGAETGSFNRDIEISRGEQQIRIPLEEIRGRVRPELDLRRIRAVTFFVWRPQHTIELCLGRLRLE